MSWVPIFALLPCLIAASGYSRAQTTETGTPRTQVSHAANCTKDADCPSGQRCGFTSGCKSKGKCVVLSHDTFCIDPGGRCGCDGRPVDIFCAVDSRTEFASAPVNAVGPCRKPVDDETPIVTDSMTASDYPSLRAELPDGSCGKSRPYSEPPTTVEEFAGGTVKTIRVVRTAPRSNPLRVEDIRETVRHVWQSKFQTASCGIVWSEVTAWSIESVLEFEDGERGALITDGAHVALQDHDGRKWFFRLLPAGQ